MYVKFVPFFFSHTSTIVKYSQASKNMYDELDA